jgi:ATP-dependent protease ClpP protease subunit
MKKWYQIRRVAAVATAAAALASGAQAAAASSAEIWIYADIGESWWKETVTAKDLCKEIADLDVDAITVRVNSFGGSVTDGLAIYNALKRHRAEVTVSVDGIAASIASLICMAGDRVEVAENARMMVHAPWVYALGNAKELREVADMLDGWAKSMAASYAKKSGKPVDDVMAWFEDGQDHWFSADEAVAEGLADVKTDALPADDASARSKLAWAKSTQADNLASSLETLMQYQQAEQLARGLPLSRAIAAAIRNPNFAAAAAPQQEKPTMTPEEKAAAEAKRQEELKAAGQAAAAAEAKRQAEIRAAFAPHASTEGCGALLEQVLADTGCTIEQAKAKLLDIKGKGAEPVAGRHVVTLEDEQDKRRAAMRASLEIRAGLGKNDTANPWRGHTLGEIARACLAAAGVRDVPGDKMGMIAMAFTHSTSDFPLLLANVAQKAMMKGYDEADETFQVWTTPGSLPDFKVMSNVDIGSFPALRAVPEGAEYKYITIGERREQRVLATYGERFSITRQAVINDDLDAFARIPRKMGRAAIRTVGNLAYAVLTGNPNMADGVALFHANHGNTAAAAVITTAAVDAMRVAMARQKDIGQTSGSLNIRLKTLIVPVAYEGTAKVVRDSEFEVVSAAPKNHTIPNSVRGTFDVVSDARLDDAAQPTNWYGAADGSMHDTVIVDYLDGQQTPTLEQQNGWAVDGAEFKVRMDAAAKALDWKTLQRNGV